MALHADALRASAKLGDGDLIFADMQDKVRVMPDCTAGMQPAVVIQLAGGDDDDVFPLRRVLQAAGGFG